MLLCTFGTVDRDRAESEALGMEAVFCDGGVVLSGGGVALAVAMRSGIVCTGGSVGCRLLVLVAARLVSVGLGSEEGPLILGAIVV